MAYIDIILSENNLSDIIIEEIVCRNTCVEWGSLSEEFYEKMAAILNKMAAISCVDKKTSRPTECAQHCGIVFKILYEYHIMVAILKTKWLPLL
jgi:hypothetical protein